MSKKQSYQKLSHREHVLKRPDTVIGSIRPVETEQYIVRNKEIVGRTLKLSHGFLKIFDEILVNAADQVARTIKRKNPDDVVSEIRVTVDKTSGEISVWNDGLGIPVEMHKKEKMWIAELIFGVMLTGQNFDDSEKRTTGGKNGYGAKLANIFSKYFILETADQKKKKRFRMKWVDNMASHEAAEVTEFNKDEFVGTKITFLPDYEKFLMKGLSNDLIGLLKRRTYDIAACTPSNIRVYFNDTFVPIKSLSDYAKLVISGQTVAITKPRWDLILGLSDGNGMQQISFVNTIHTLHGGTHVDSVVNQITKYVQTTMEKMPEFKDKGTKHTVKVSDIKKHINLVLSAVIENPDFDSQSKETLKTPPELFGSTLSLSTSVLKGLVDKLGLIERIKDVLLARNLKSLQKGNNTKKNRLFGIPKLEDANFAGTRKSDQTMLFVTEGDSAASMVRAGLSVLGRDKYGIFPLRGKLLNVRSASTKDAGKNEEIQNLIKILGLRIDMAKKYTADNITTLRYGGLCILTDQDHDGSHIKGLVLNFLHVFFPSLLEVEGFLKFFITPISKVSKGSVVRSFYTYNDMEQWFKQNNQGAGWRTKFYKGLGTSTSKEAKEYFSDLPKHLIDFKFTTEKTTKNCLELAFKKEFADKRKVWVNRMNALEEPRLEYDPNLGMTYDDFIDDELILFSVADNIRSLPSVIDGMKPSQRKVLYGSMTRSKKYEDIKVSQLAGDISLRTAYHHGEASLIGTIIGMAQDFTGSNNINQLIPSGQFGSRVMGGKDHASARYIFTRLNDIVDTIYHSDDLPLLTYNVDDGQSVEPTVFVPILPMLLVNGSSGIGTGYSCNIPSYNPIDIVENIRRKMKNEKMKSMKPWYHDHVGEVTKKDTKYLSYGKFERKDDCTVYVSELPVGVWTQTFKEKLMKHMEKKDTILKNINEYSTERIVGFELEFTSKKYLDDLLAMEDVDKQLDLQSTIKNLLYGFGSDGRIKNFKNANEIIDEFYGVRFTLYTKRRLYLLIKYGRTIRILENKLRYLREVIDGKLVVFRKSKAFREQQLVDQSFDMFDMQADLTKENYDANGSYNYLTSMSIDSFGLETIERLEKELEKFKSFYTATEKLDEMMMWNRDLDAFMERYEVFRQEQIQVVETERLGRMEVTKKKRKRSTKKNKTKK